MATTPFLDLQWKLAGLESQARGAPGQIPFVVNVRDQDKPPLVTVFGGGITGLSVAQELIERGFGVQVVESAESTIAEYAAGIGGMAANQYSRVPGELREILDLRPERPDGKPVKHLKQATRVVDWPLKVRGLRMRPVQRRFALHESIVFNRHSSVDWLHEKDPHGVTNEAKLQRVLDKVYRAFREYYAEYRERMEKLKIDDSQIEIGGKLPIEYWREILAVRVIGLTVDNQVTTESRGWADEVIDVLLKKLDPARADRPGGGFELGNHLVRVGLGEAAFGSPIASRQRFGGQQSDRVNFEIIEQIMPGEHGFRFFPAFYRNLFDTMKRVPSFDRFGVESHETAYSHLVPAADPSVSVERGKAAVEINYRTVKSLHDLEQLSRFVFDSVGFTERDVLRLQVRLFRYLTSCTRRRIEQCEAETFWRYIGGEDKSNGYSGRAGEFIQHAPRALAAMAATEVDARTQANILLQMLIRQPFEELPQDFTLNGSTSQAFLDVWKAYLNAQGVKFFTGRLERIELGKGWVKKDGRWVLIDEFVPFVTGPVGWRVPRPEKAEHRYLNVERHVTTSTPDAGIADEPDFANTAVPTNFYHDFFVLAVPLDEASRLVRDAWKQLEGAGFKTKDDEERARARFAGPFLQLIDFDDATDRKLRDPADPLKGVADPVRNPATGAVFGVYPDKGKCPYRDISGIQYFFPNRYRFGNGHVYLADSDWGLTSISQLAYARDRTSPIGRFLGQVSVDIGDWYTPWKQDSRGGLATSAWRSRRKDIAESTWEQMKQGLDSTYAGFLLPPQFYHLDWGIRFDETERGGFSGNILTAVTPATHDRLTIVYTAPGSPSFTGDYVGSPYDELTGLNAIAARINDDERVFAHVSESPEHQQTLTIAPYVKATNFKIVAKQVVKGPYAIAIRFIKGGPLTSFQAGRAGETYTPEQVFKSLRSAIEREELPVDVVVRGNDFDIESASESQIEVAVASYKSGVAIGSARILDDQKVPQPANLKMATATLSEPQSGVLPWKAQLSIDNATTYTAVTLVLEGDEFFLSFGDRNRTGATLERAYKVYGTSVTRDLAARITDNVYTDQTIKNDAEVFAWHHTPGLGSRGGAHYIVLSPMVRANEVILHVKEDSKRKYAGKYAVIIAVRNPGAGTREIYEASTRDKLIDRIQAGTLASAKAYGTSGILVNAKGATDVLFSVANADDCIRIESARGSGTDPVLRALKVHVRGRHSVLPLQILRGPHAGTADIRRVNVAGKCFVNIPSAVVPGRRYVISANLAGKAPTRGEVKATDATTAEEIAKSLADELDKNGHLSAVAEWNGNGHRVVISPQRPSTIPLELALINVDLDAADDVSTPLRNSTPFLINLPGQWQLRPGRSSRTEKPGSGHEHPKSEMTYTHSDPLLRRWVPAGTWMATDTRMTTMEAANESAKHAVNGMLHMIMTPEMGGCTGEIAFGAQHKLLGDFADTYRPEDFEFRDLANLCKVDERLMAEGKPHFIDILRITELVDKLPATGIAKHGNIDDYYALLRGVNESLLNQTPILGKQFVGVLMQSLMDRLEDYLRRNFGANR